MKEIIQGNLVDIKNKTIHFGELTIENDKIIELRNLGEEKKDTPYILPGFIDAHVHIESSMLVPSEFAKIAVIHGTVATISDPHEIANVCGIDGVDFMIENGNSVPFKFHFGAPSCVPATNFETAGAEINANQIEELLRRDDIFYLTEMMNFPGVLAKDEVVMKKLEIAQKLQKPIDGHAPGLMGDQAIQYIQAGISTDHECFTMEEALHKIKNGMKILIREGSAAKNFDALIDLLHDYEDEIMFCSDDKHPDSLVEGHINQLCARAVEKGIDIFKILKAACINPIDHYKMKVGQLRIQDPADFIVCENLKNFKIQATYINGQKVAENGKTFIQAAKSKSINHFDCELKSPKDFEIVANSNQIRVIQAIDGQLITESKIEISKIVDGKILSDTQKDILKLIVINRYQKNTMIAKAFIHNFGLKSGAIASSVAHDSHNIIAVGVDDQSICEAVNLTIQNQGGVSLAHPEKPEMNQILALPIAGLMSNEDGFEIAKQYTQIDQAAKNLGSQLSAPFMTLSFMALLVIPKLKLSDKGLFDGENFCFVDSQIEG